MKNNIIKIFALAISFMTLAQSCDLDRNPKDLIVLDDSFKSFNDAKKWNNGLYATLRQVLGGEYVVPQEVQADMLNDCYGEYSTLHGWTTRVDGSFFNFYQNYYALLIDVNIVINKIPTLTVKETQKSELDVFLGNAHFIRAYYYFNLALRWGVPYQEATADTDLCVPMETKAFTLDKKPRATNAEIYGLILSDLAKAEKLLASVPVMQGSQELSADLVKALRARVYLYMDKMDEALKEAEGLIKSDTYPLIKPLPVGAVDPNGFDNPFVQMWHLDSGVEQIWQPFISKPDELPKTIQLYGADLDSWKAFASVVGSANVNNPAYLPTGRVVYDLFDVKNSKDRRIPAYFEEAWLTKTKTMTKAKAFVISKFKGNPNYANINTVPWGGYRPNGIQAPKPFRIAEQYLIASEAAYNVGDNAKALKYLNELRASRGLDPVKAFAYELEKAIQDERARELAYEGFRLWDLRRWHLGINGRPRQGNQDVVNKEGYGKKFLIPNEFFSIHDYTKLVIKPNNYKFVWAFPYNEVTKVNKNIVQNKGW